MWWLEGAANAEEVRFAFEISPCCVIGSRHRLGLGLALVGRGVEGFSSFHMSYCLLVLSTHTSAQ
jgi:hypothetical protein